MAGVVEVGEMGEVGEEGEEGGEGEGMSTASQVESSKRAEVIWVVSEMWAESFRAVAQRVAEAETMDERSFRRSAESAGRVSGWRIVRIPWTEDSIWLDTGVELYRALIPRRVRTLQTLSLDPPEAESEMDIVSKNWLMVLSFGMLSCGKNGCQTESHREDEMTCSTFLILRNSETGDGQMGVAAKMGLSLQSSWWMASGF